jgi:hypothetical protein
MALRQVAVDLSRYCLPLGTAGNAGATIFKHHPLRAHEGKIMLGMPVNSTAATLQKTRISVQAVYTNAPGLTQFLPFLPGSGKKNGASHSAVKGLD